MDRKRKIPINADIGQIKQNNRSLINTPTKVSPVITINKTLINRRKSLVKSSDSQVTSPANNGMIILTGHIEQNGGDKSPLKYPRDISIGVDKT
jgi:hypothetical protein